MGSTTDSSKDVLTDAKGWSQAGSRYNDVIGATTGHGTSRLVEVVDKILPFTAESAVVDVGAGGGSLTFKVKQKAPQTSVLATDIAEGMLKVIDTFKVPGVSTRQVDAVKLEGLKDDSFTHGLTSFAIQFTPDPYACIESLYRVVRPNGLVGVAIWGVHVGPGDVHNDACKILDPAYAPAQPEVSNAWRDEPTHREKLLKAGLQDVGTERVKMKFECGDAQGACDYWFRGTNPVPAKLVGHWVAHGGSKEDLEREFRKLVDDMFARGQSLHMDAVLGWGRKRV